MPSSDSWLLKRLGIALVIKLILLMGLWWGLIRDQRVSVDTTSMAQQVLVHEGQTVLGDDK